MNKKLFGIMFAIIMIISTTSYMIARHHGGGHFFGGVTIGVGSPFYYDLPGWRSRYWGGPWPYAYPAYYGPVVQEDVYREPKGPRPSEIFDAISRGNLDDVKLLATKINLNIMSDGRQGKTPLIWAVQHGQIAIIEWLLTQGVNINAQDKTKNTALHSSTEQEDDIAARLLLEHGALVDVQNKQKQTALHLAVKKQSVALVNLLMEFGANPTILDNNKRSPMKLAEKTNNQGVLQALKTPQTLKRKREDDNNDSEQNTKHSKTLPRVPVQGAKTAPGMGSANG
jgi:hypothetical protein